jgi:hypothetical protein
MRVYEIQAKTEGIIWKEPECPPFQGDNMILQW